MYIWIIPVKGSKDLDLSRDMRAEFSVAVLDKEPSDLAFTNLSAGLTPNISQSLNRDDASGVSGSTYTSFKLNLAHFLNDKSAQSQQLKSI